MEYNYYYKDKTGARHLVTAPPKEGAKYTTVQGKASDMQEVSRHISFKNGHIIKKYIYKLTDNICRETLKTNKLALDLNCDAHIKDVGVTLKAEAEYDEKEDTVAIIATILVAIGIGAIFLGMTPLAALLICLGLLIFVCHMVDKV